MSLSEKINENMKSAMQAKDKFRTGVLRMLLSEFKYAMTAEQRVTSLDDEQALKVLKAYRKRLEKSLEAYPEGERRQEITQEIAIVDEYLPAEEAEGVSS